MDEWRTACIEVRKKKEKEEAKNKKENKKCIEEEVDSGDSELSIKRCYISELSDGSDKGRNSVDSNKKE